MVFRIKIIQMGEKISLCNAKNHLQAEEIIFQREKSNNEKQPKTLNNSELAEEKNQGTQQKQSQRNALVSLQSKSRKNMPYLKLNKGAKLETVPNFLSEQSKKKLQQLGEFIFDKDQELEDPDSEYHQPLFFDNRYVYEGQWKNRQRNGKGRQTWKDGSIYQGYWKNNLAFGYGRLIHGDGDVFTGEWKNDRANGNGVYTSHSGAKYSGFWKDDKQEDVGQQQWKDGATYKGQYKDGKKHGKGIFTWVDGCSFQGQFVQNQFEGIGIYKWKDGRIYEGGWKNSKMEGKGVFIWPDGRSYEGQYKNDKKEGFGTFTFRDGRKYEGQWKNGKQHGRGFFKKKNLSREGIWQNGSRTQWIQKQNEPNQNLQATE